MILETLNDEQESVVQKTEVEHHKQREQPAHNPNMGQAWVFSGKRTKTQRPGQCGVRSGQTMVSIT